MFSHRVSGILVRDGKVLLQAPKNTEDYAFPGGHVSLGETIAETLAQEWLEEVGADIGHGFASDHSSTSYEFLAVDKPLRKKERLDVSKLSGRVSPTSRRAHFIYDVDGYDIPGGWEKLMTQYYDVMYREEYGWWSLAMAFNASHEQFDDLAKYGFDGEEEGIGVEISFIEQNRIIITIHCSIEDYYDNDGGEDDDDSENGLFKTNNGLLNALTHIRRQIAAGDYRALYAVWEKYGDKDDENPPPKPQSQKKGEGIIKNFIGRLGCIE